MTIVIFTENLGTSVIKGSRLKPSVGESPKYKTIFGKYGKIITQNAPVSRFNTFLKGN